MTGAVLLFLAVAAPPPATYDVRCGPRCAELRVEASLPAAGDDLHIEKGVGRFLRAVQFEAGGRWVEATVRGDEVAAPGCGPRPCRLRYRVLLADAARHLEGRGRAFAQGGVLVAPPSSWLLRPANEGAGGRFRLRVTPAPGTRFATGLFGAPGAYEGTLEDLEESPYSAFGSFEAATVRSGGGVIEVAIAPALTHRRRAITAWVDAAARDVAGFFGRYPVPRALVLVLAGRRPGISFGDTQGNGGASILIWVSPDAGADVFARDPVLVHEMVHFGLPAMPRRHRWFEEGLATYVEPIARAAGGRLAPAEVWSLLLDGLPRAVPGPSGKGLDESRSWASTYWGGALFSFLADVGIREATGNRRSLRDALRGIQEEGGSIAVRWPLERTLEAGDRATGTKVMRDLHVRMGRRVEVDLDHLWRRLGVARKGRTVAFDDGAPLARIRRSIAEGPTGRR
jgi:hypothetical protein